MKVVRLPERGENGAAEQSRRQQAVRVVASLGAEPKEALAILALAERLVKEFLLISGA